MYLEIVPLPDVLRVRYWKHPEIQYSRDTDSCQESHLPTVNCLELYLWGFYFVLLEEKEEGRQKTHMLKADEKHMHILTYFILLMGRTQEYCWGNLWDPRDNFRIFLEEHVGTEYWGWTYEPKDTILAFPQATVWDEKRELIYLFSRRNPR